MIIFPSEIDRGIGVINAHLFFEILAYGLGIQYYIFLRKGIIDLLTTEQRWVVILGGGMGATWGSKLLGLLEHPELWLLSEQSIFYLFSSKTVVGGLLGGLIGVEVTKKIFKIPHSSGDLFCFPVILGMMIGRIGCFLSGVGDGTHGLPTDFILGMDLGDGIQRHPTALYEIFVLGGIWGFLKKIKHSVQLLEGSLFKLFMVSYLGWRLGIEWIKPVHCYFGLSILQMACIMGLLYYHRVFLFPRTLLRNVSHENG